MTVTTNATLLGLNTEQQQLAMFLKGLTKISNGVSAPENSLSVGSVTEHPYGHQVHPHLVKSKKMKVLGLPTNASKQDIPSLSNAIEQTMTKNYPLKRRDLLWVRIFTAQFVEKFDQSSGSPGIVLEVCYRDHFANDANWVRAIFVTGIEQIIARFGNNLTELLSNIKTVERFWRNTDSAERFDSPVSMSVQLIQTDEPQFAREILEAQNALVAAV